MSDRHEPENHAPWLVINPAPSPDELATIIALLAYRGRSASPPKVVERSLWLEAARRGGLRGAVEPSRGWARVARLGGT